MVANFIVNNETILLIAKMIADMKISDNNNVDNDQNAIFYSIEQSTQMNN